MTTALAGNPASQHHDRDAPAVSTAEIIAAVEAAVDEHLQWLHHWNRALVCRQELPQEFGDGASTSCRFGTWYALHRHESALVDQPAFHDLAEAHERLHLQARALAKLSRVGAAVPVEAYDQFVAAVGEFNARARRIGAAFQRLLSDLDPLTGAHSRQTMMAELEREAARARRTGAPFCVALVDLDHFKRVNDTHGHAAGDRVLATTAGRLLAQVRPYDAVFRYGGEEFLLCLPNADGDAARAICERLRTAVAESPVELDDGTPVAVTASFGIAALAAGPVKELVAAADRALYEAKRDGRNRVVVARVAAQAADWGQSR